MSIIAPTWRRPSRTLPIGKDPSFANVILHVPFNGANGSTTFTDFSSGARTVTGFGSAAISTTGAEQNRSHLLLDNTSGKYLSVTLPAFGTGDFAIETDIYPITFTNNNNIIENRASEADGAGFVFGVSTGGELFLYTGNAFRLLTGKLAVNNWYKVALTRSSGVWRILMDGKLQTGSYTSSANLTRTDTRIGTSWNSSYWANCRLRNYRISTVARYTANYTPLAMPTPFPIA
jgi:hypothetical protein